MLGMSTDTQDPPGRRVNLKLPDDVHVRLKVVAAKRRRTLQDMLASWIVDRLQQEERELSEERR